MERWYKEIWKKNNCLPFLSKEMKAPAFHSPHIERGVYIPSPYLGECPLLSDHHTPTHAKDRPLVVEIHLSCKYY